VAIGSRYVKGGGVYNWPKNRIYLSMGGSIYTRAILWTPIRDQTAGFVCFRREVLATINLDEIHFVGYAFQIEMKFAAWKLGFKLKEVPIQFTDRQFGESKMNRGIIKEGVLGVLKLRWYSFFTNYRRRVKSHVSEPIGKTV
jgi:dolichol-phosphate mannosyltransferase